MREQVNEKRIAVNTLVNYFRSVLGALIGLFSARWVLEALGSSDLGLYGVVGGVVFVFSFLTPVFSLAISRFYAFSIEKPDQVRQLFNTSVMVMSVLALGLVALAYPIGLSALEHWLVVPDGRMDAAVWVLRFALLTAMASMFSTPYVAMFYAKQDIAEASLYQLAQSVLAFCFVIFMKVCRSVSDGGGTDWLVAYAGALSGIAVGLCSVQMCRVRWKYSECALEAKRLFVRDQVRPLLVFVGWQIIGGFAWMVRFQGLTFFVNRFFGTAYNASYTISNQVSNQAASLSNSFSGALEPVIASAEGGGRRREMLRLARNSSLLSGGLVLLFAVPLAIFINPVLKLWLKNPPPGCASLCVAMLTVAVLRQFAAGQGMAILAHGKLGAWQVCDALAIVMALPFAYLFWKCGMGIGSVGWAYVVSEAIASVNRFVFAKKLKA